MTFGVPGSQKLVEGARVEQQKSEGVKERQLDTRLWLNGGYKFIGEMGRWHFQN